MTGRAFPAFKSRPDLLGVGATSGLPKKGISDGSALHCMSLGLWAEGLGEVPREPNTP